MSPDMILQVLRITEQQKKTAQEQVCVILFVRYTQRKANRRAGDGGREGRAAGDRPQNKMPTDRQVSLLVCHTCLRKR